jgi:hypothetical protein
VSSANSSILQDNALNDPLETERTSDSTPFLTKVALLKSVHNGPGNGPAYKGPFSKWARGVKEDTDLDEKDL